MFRSMKRSRDVGEQRWKNGVGGLRTVVLLLLILMQFCVMGRSFAQLPPGGTPSQFEIVGFLQAATLGTSATKTTGGTMMVNGHVIIVPDNTIVILPANALTWQELFTQAPSPYGGVVSGLAMADTPTPAYTYEAHVIGNRVGDAYIAGLIYLSQQDLNAGAGFINYIDYGTGDIFVGGVIGARNSGTRIQINDPAGKFGRSGSGDLRFTVDSENPTVRSATGYPMCVPRKQPDPTAPSNDDPLCPEAMRTNQGNSFTTNPVAPGSPSFFPDPRFMAPLEIGDYVNYAGTLMSDAKGSYISAHTITDNIAIYTSPGTFPAYVAIEVGIIGTGGLTVIGAGEAAIRTRFEGMSTDPSRPIHLYGLDYDPATGIPKDRELGSVLVDTGPPNGALKGRWRFRPPCTVANPTIKDCTSVSGTFLPAPREVRAVIEGTPAQALAQGADPVNQTGLNAGQYHAPILQYIFPENIPGTPPPPNNFETIPFLALGGYSSSGGYVPNPSGGFKSGTATIAGQLTPWPGAQAPNACIPPTVTVPANFTVATNDPTKPINVPLSGSATGTGSITYEWVVQTDPSFVIPPATTADPAYGNSVVIANKVLGSTTFIAPNTEGKLVFNLKATACGTTVTSVPVKVTVIKQTTTSPVIGPLVSQIVKGAVSQIVGSGVPFTVSAIATPAAKYVYQWTEQKNGGAPSPITSIDTNTGSSVQITRTVAQGIITNDVYTYTVKTVTPVSNIASTTVTVKPRPDLDNIAAAVYRTSKQRLDLTVTSSISSPDLVLKLEPYKTVTGAMFDPSAVGNVLTNTGGGNYTMSLVGVPQPAAPLAAPLIVTSSIGGTNSASKDANGNPIGQPLTLLRN